VANGNFSIAIGPALQISTTSVPNGSPGVVYSATLAATGGFTPYSWAISSGSLPSGLTLNATSGVISGAPTGTGTSNFTVQVADHETPAATASASLSILVTAPPARNAALYVGFGAFAPQLNQTGLQIQNDGSLTLLPSSPEPIGGSFATSPTLPLIFMLNAPSSLGSVLVNPDYSLSSYSSVPIQLFPGYPRPSVDPTGSNLYLPGPIDSNSTLGISAYLADGSLQLSSTVVIPNISLSIDPLPGLSPVAFTPDGALAFISVCSSTFPCSILSYSRSSNGALTAGPVYSPPAGQSHYPSILMVSPDGRYLATDEVQIYTIATDGTLTAVLPQPFTVTVDPQGDFANVLDMTWDQSSSFLLASAAGPTSPDASTYGGGVAVLNFSGNTLTETIYPTASGVPTVGRILRVGSHLYAMRSCGIGCTS
jgi:hypothetical protein